MTAMREAGVPQFLINDASMSLEDWNREVQNVARRLLPACVHKLHGPHTQGPKGALYQFGVFGGGSMRFTLKRLHDARISLRQAWGLDSFQGVPETNETSERGISWGPLGRICSAADLLKSYNVTELLAKIRANIASPATPVDFVVGFFNESLTPTLAAERQMQPALIVDIDTDLYISAFQALSWLFSSRLMRSGTLVYFDEWPHGESKAWADVAALYDVVSEELVRDPPRYLILVVLDYRNNPSPAPRKQTVKALACPPAPSRTQRECCTTYGWNRLNKPLPPWARGKKKR